MRDVDSSVIAVVSPKGGVGKTTLTANLAMALVDGGHAVLAVDLDPQNALRLHLQRPFEEVDGLAVQMLNDQPWSSAIQKSPTGVDVLPFGQLDDDAIELFERRCADDGDWLSRGLASLNLSPHTVVLVDTPPGSAPQVRQAVQQAQIMLGVLMPEASSLVTVATLERWLGTWCTGRNDFVQSACVINGVNDDPLSAAVVQSLDTRLGAHFATHRVHRSDALRESFAAAQTLSDYAPTADVQRDFRVLAHWLVTHL